jgi:hypothetical protein
MAAPRTIALSHRGLAPVETYRGSRRAQNRDKRYDLHYAVHDYSTVKGKGNVIPLQAYGAHRVPGRLRLPDSVTSALEGGRLSAIRTGRLYPRSILVLILRG